MFTFWCIKVFLSVTKLMMGPYLLLRGYPSSIPRSTPPLWIVDRSSFEHWKRIVPKPRQAKCSLISFIINFTKFFLNIVIESIVFSLTGLHKNDGSEIMEHPHAQNGIRVLVLAHRWKFIDSIYWWYKIPYSRELYCNKFLSMFSRLIHVVIYTSSNKYTDCWETILNIKQLRVQLL